MGYDKRHLRQLLELIKNIYGHPDADEFTKGIRSMVLMDEEFQKFLKDLNIHSGGSDGFENVEKYLSLDFAIDSKDFPNYSAIKEEAVRERLQSDFREMLRYRFGTRNHKVDFPEFCRFAHLQAEMLVNYYFEKKYGNDLKAALKDIKEAVPKYVPSKYVKEVSDIPFKNKLSYVQKATSLDFSDLFNTAEVRNKQSHRSLKANKDLIRDTEEKLKAAEAWNERFGTPVYKKNEAGVSLAAAAVGQDILNEYKFQVWYDKQPFGSIISGLKKLTDKVVSSL